MSLYKKAFTLYLILLHLLCGILIVKTDMPSILAFRLGIQQEYFSPYYYEMIEQHKSLGKSLTNDSTLFIGDSITRGLDVNAITENGINFGIHGDTTVGVIKRLVEYSEFLDKPGVFVIAIGVNDLSRRGHDEILANTRKIIDLLPEQRPILLSAILPVDERTPNLAMSNTNILAINAAYLDICASNLNVHCVNATDHLIDETGNLAASHHIGDGVHPSPLGYSQWTKVLRNSIHNLIWPQKHLR